MKREPRLQFSDADLAEPKLEKPIKRVKKAEAKADKAQAKIPKKTVVEKERGFDPATGKHFLNEILSLGGSRPAIDNFRAFRGRDPQVDALLRHSGMISG